MTIITRAAGSPAKSSLHDERVAAILGIALGISFTTCFVTGLLSHLIQNPPSWFTWPPRPAGLYRVTQGLHVATGIASIPLLFAKLWVVYPKLFERPVVGSVARAVERVSLVPLIGGAIFQVWSGIANINQWYPWPFGFKASHYWVAWITMGALVVHMGAKWATTAAALRRSPIGPRVASESPGIEDATTRSDRRTFLASVFATSGLLTLFSVGQTIRPLERLALLAPRRPNVGPQGFPVNRTARGVGVVDTARSPDYRLVVDGNVQRRMSLTYDELQRLPSHEATLPISCVEGWSATAIWRGVRVRDLLDLAGARDGASVDIHSLQRGYGTMLDAGFIDDPDTLLALRVNGQPLHLDHGYPCRLIAPNRPGTMQTKWVARITVR